MCIYLKVMFINGYKIYFSVHLVYTNFSDFAEQGLQTFTRTMVPNYWCNFILVKKETKFAKMSTLYKR